MLGGLQISGMTERQRASALARIYRIHISDQFLDLEHQTLKCLAMFQLYYVSALREIHSL
jgi:hypothetical protein